MNNLRLFVLFVFVGGAVVRHATLRIRIRTTSLYIMLTNTLPALFRIIFGTMLSFGQIQGIPVL